MDTTSIVIVIGLVLLITGAFYLEYRAEKNEPDNSKHDPTHGII